MIYENKARIWFLLTNPETAHLIRFLHQSVNFNHSTIKSLLARLLYNEFKL